LLEQLEQYKARPAAPELPWRFETGTQSHEGLAGITATVDYFASIGQSMAQDYAGNWSQFSGRRRDVHAALELLFDYEKLLASRLIEGLLSIDGITIQGISNPEAMDRRVPTVSFTHDKKSPDFIAEELARRNIFVWCGHNYALEVARTLGLLDSGGAVRVGPVHYNSIEEIDELLQAMRTLLNG
jgi:selenocysteine lyase/cysteine desulfurase